MAQRLLWARASSLSRIHDHTQSDTPHSLGRLWLSDEPNTQSPVPDNTQHTQQLSMPQVGFEPTIPAIKQLQTHALDCVATWISNSVVHYAVNV